MELAAKLARGIFEVGTDARNRVQRIALMGGLWPDHETNLGGLNEQALTGVLFRLLEQFGVGKEAKP